MKIFKNTVVIVIIVATILVGSVSAFFSRGNHGSNILSNAVGIIVSPLQKIITYIADSVADFNVFIWESNGYKAQNDKLLKEVNDLKLNMKSMDEYMQENERLKRLLALKEDMPQYDFVAAQIVSKSGDNWNESFIVNRGSKYGIKKNDVVVTDFGLVGQVSEVGYTWSKITTILDPSSSVGVVVPRTNEAAMIEGDVLYAKDKLCKMSFLPYDNSIVIGDIAQTSGIGGMYQPGFTVGTVREITVNPNDKLTYAIVEPAVNFNKLKEVMIIINGQVEE